MNRNTLTLKIMALCFAVALPADVSMSATLDQVPGSTTTPKGWIKVTHNAGTPQKPVNKPLYINVSQIWSRIQKMRLRNATGLYPIGGRQCLRAGVRRRGYELD
jgi:hypothetical protein